MFLTVTVRNDKGEAVGMIILKDKEFSSGKGGGGRPGQDRGGRRAIPGAVPASQDRRKARS